jgi:hypothetical protein
MLQFLCWIAGCGVSATLGVIFSQKIKDWVAGIPAHARAEINKLETAVIDRVKKGL